VEGAIGWGTPAKELSNMAESRKNALVDQWTSLQAYGLAIVCLLIGLAGGWFMRGARSSGALAAVSENAGKQAGGQPSLEDMKRTADKQVEPLLAQLKNDPNNFELLTNIANVYYDTHQFPPAIDYYQRALRTKPEDASVRTDMATAYWYTGDAETAISEFKRALSYEPNKANALFNLGIVEWQGKMGVERALVAWQKLLDTNPKYENKEKLLELMAQVKKHSGIKPGTQAKALAE
jgi:tetratricopeptide (TPR) repeat protein